MSRISLSFNFNFKTQQTFGFLLISFNCFCARLSKLSKINHVLNIVNSSCFSPMEMFHSLLIDIDRCIISNPIAFIVFLLLYLRRQTETLTQAARQDHLLPLSVIDWLAGKFVHDMRFRSLTNVLSSSKRSERRRRQSSSCICAVVGVHIGYSRYMCMQPYQCGCCGRMTQRQNQNQINEQQNGKNNNNNNSREDKRTTMLAAATNGQSINKYKKCQMRRKKEKKN